MDTMSYIDMESELPVYVNDVDYERPSSNYCSDRNIGRYSWSLPVLPLEEVDEPIRRRLDTLEDRLQRLENARKWQSISSATMLTLPTESRPKRDDSARLYQKRSSVGNCLTIILALLVVAGLAAYIIYVTLNMGSQSQAIVEMLLQRERCDCLCCNGTGQNTSAQLPGHEQEEQNVPRLSGVVYTRWGRTVCPQNATRIYKGFSASGHFDHTGGASNTLCLPEVPSWGRYTKTEDYLRSQLYGSEYEAASEIMDGATQNGDVPCCVCQASDRVSIVQVPGRVDCFPGWTLEYTGYLMGGRSDGKSAKELICMDEHPEELPDGYHNDDGHRLYPVETKGGALPMPPYIKGRELACCVCTQ